MITPQFEVFALLGAVIAAVVAPRALKKPADALIRGLDVLGSRPRLCIGGAAAAAFVGAALTASLTWWPAPSIHDEWSYMLAAETFAEGRLANPTHPMWEHFESHHILQHPTYASKYPPGQGLSLAVGLATCGDAVPSLWLQAGTMCAAVAWALFGWLPRRWAALGTLALLLQLGISGYWAQSFWGGALAATGGGLMFGALPRLLRRARVTEGLILGLGVAICAYTRPFEGLVASIPIAVAILVRLVRRSETRLPLLSRGVLPALLVLALAGAWMALHNQAVTGQASRLPYDAYDEQYAIYPPFLWQARREAPEYRVAILESFATNFQKGDYENARTFGDYVGVLLDRAGQFVTDLSGFLLILPLLAGLATARLRRSRFAVLSLALMGLAMCTTTYFSVHYVAPITPLLFGLVAVGLRDLRQLGGSRGHAFLAAAVLALAAVCVVRAVDVPTDKATFGAYRAKFERNLSKQDGKHLVVIRYEPGHVLHHEWVYNHADIENASVVFAHDLGDEKNTALLQHFHDRHVWMIVDGGNGPKVFNLDSQLGRGR